MSNYQQQQHPLALYQPPVGGEGGAGSVASRSGSGSGNRSHASNTSSSAQQQQSGHPYRPQSLPAGVTVKVPAVPAHHHHQIHQPPLCHPPMSHPPSGLPTQLRGRSAYHQQMNDGDAGGGLSMSTGGGSGGGRAYPRSTRQQCQYGPGHHQYYSRHQPEGRGEHTSSTPSQHRGGQVGAGADANDRHRQNHHHDGIGTGTGAGAASSEPPHAAANTVNNDDPMTTCTIAAAYDPSLYHPTHEEEQGGRPIMQQQQATSHHQHQHVSGDGATMPGGMYQDLVGGPGNAPAAAVPPTCDAVLEKIVAAAAEVHHAVQYALQVGVSSSPPVEHAQEEEEVGANYDNEVDMIAGGVEGRRQGRRRRRRRSDHTAGAVGGDDEAGVDAVDGGTTYDRRRAARRVLRGLAALEETIGTLSSSVLTVAADADCAVDCDDVEANGNVSSIANDEEGCGDDEAKTSSQLLVHDGGDEEKDQDLDQQENGDYSEKGDVGHEPNADRPADLIGITLDQMVADLLIIPTEVRGALLVDDLHESDGNDGDNQDFVDAGGSRNTGSNGIVRLLDESDIIACRVIVQYLTKSTDQYRLLASLVPARPLPPWNSVDGLLGRVFPQFVAVGGDRTYPTYRETTAIILSVINSIGSEYAVRGLSVEIPVIDAFVLCHYLARRGLVDLTTTDVAPDLKGGGADTAKEAMEAAAALQLRKLIVRILGRLLECLAGARAGMGAFSGSGLLHCLVAESQRLRVEAEDNSGTIVSTNDVEDCVDILSEYCTEVMEYALDSLDGFNSLMKGATSDAVKDMEEAARRGHRLGQSNSINDAHVEGLRESIRSVQIAVKTFSTLRQLGIHPEPSTVKSFVENLSDFWAISCNKLMNVARRPLLHGGVIHQLSEDMQQSIDAAGQQLIHIGMLTKPSSTAAGRQRGGNKGSKRSTNTKEQKSARFVAIASALSQSQRGGGSDDLSLLLHGFAKRSIGPETCSYQNCSGVMKSGDMQRRHVHDTKRQKRKVSFEDDSPMDERVPSRCGNYDDNGMDSAEGKENGGKDDPIFLLKKSDEEGTADSNLVNACMLSSLLLPEYPSLAPQVGCGGEENCRPNASFEESYKTSAAFATGMSIQAGSETHIRSLVCDPSNPWHALIGRRITDTVARRDASGICHGGADAVVDSTSSEARGVLLRHAEACRAGAS